MQFTLRRLTELSTQQHYGFKRTVKEAEQVNRLVNIIFLKLQTHNKSYWEIRAYIYYAYWEKI